MANQNSIQDAQADIDHHLSQLRSALDSPNCEIDVLLKKKGETESSPYSTAFTLQQLGYDTEDIKNTLYKLTISDYIETIADTVKTGSRFYVFGIEIEGKEIYIKEKLRAERNIFCISFHFAKFPLKNKPYGT